MYTLLTLVLGVPVSEGLHERAATPVLYSNCEGFSVGRPSQKHTTVMPPLPRPTAALVSDLCVRGTDGKRGASKGSETPESNDEQPTRATSMRHLDSFSLQCVHAPHPGVLVPISEEATRACSRTLMPAKGREAPECIISALCTLALAPVPGAPAWRELLAHVEAP